MVWICCRFLKASVSPRLEMPEIGRFFSRRPLNPARLSSSMENTRHRETGKTGSNLKFPKIAINPMGFRVLLLTLRRRLLSHPSCQLQA
jgi:hypothetical protein